MRTEHGTHDGKWRPEGWRILRIPPRYTYVRMQYSPMPQAKTHQNVHAVTFAHQFMIRGRWLGSPEHTKVRVTGLDTNKQSTRSPPSRCLPDTRARASTKKTVLTQIDWSLHMCVVCVCVFFHSAKTHIASKSSVPCNIQLNQCAQSGPFAPQRGANHAPYDRRPALIKSHNYRAPGHRR